MIQGGKKSITLSIQSFAKKEKGQLSSQRTALHHNQIIILSKSYIKIILP